MMNHGYLYFICRPKTIVLFVCCFFLISLSLSVSAETVEKAKLSPAQIAERYSSSVVLILGMSAEKHSAVLGTGFLVTPSGVIVTNHHVMKEVFPAQVKLTNGDVYDKISVIEIDERKDIAVIKISGFSLHASPLANSDDVIVGSRVVVIGNPEGLEGSVTDGLVSAIRDTGEGFKIFQISAAVSHGSSGSPVFNEYGEVIGIASATLKDGQNLNFAVPLNYARGMISEKEKMTLEEFSKVPGAALFNAASGTSELSANEWGKKMLPVISMLHYGMDCFYFGRWQTLEPHRKKFESKHFTISQYLYMAKEAFTSAEQSIQSFAAGDSELKEVQEKTKLALSKFSEATDKEISALKTVTHVIGFSDYNRISGEAVALDMSGCNALNAIGKSFAEVYKNKCPEQLSHLPWVLSQIPSEYKIPPVRLGISLWVSLDYLLVMRVEPDSSAEKAGLKPGDRINGIRDGARFPTKKEYDAYMELKKPGDVVELEIFRDGKTKFVKITLMPQRP